jgi:hypothetical protein
LAVFDAFRVEGALLQPEMLDRIVNLGATAQDVSDYELDKGEKLRDVVTTKFALAQSLHARFVNSDMGQQACRRFLTAFFTQVLEFTDLQDAPPRTIDGRSYPISHHALSGRVPIVLAPPGKLDEPLPAFGDGARRRSAPQLLQEYLNAEPSSLWGIACDGLSLRLYRDNNALTRPAYIEADLFRIFEADAPRLSDFSALWLVAHASRFGKSGAPATESPLERWREEGLKQGATAREKLKSGVELALKELGLGLMEHPQNEKLRTELGNGSLPPQAFLQALLRMIYRFIFVLTVEDRGVLHSLPPDDDREFEAWRRGKEAYAKGYSLGRLRDQATKRQFRNRHSDAWQGVLILMRELWRGQKLLALPALGGLFARSEVREFDDCLISNEHLFKALRHLGWLDTPSGLQRVNWRDMETEELGSVYESLLELTPKLFGSPKFDLVTAAGNARKTTASYYTPDSLVQALLDETLDPLIEETVKDKSPDQAAAALLALRIIDPACGSGHFLLAAARRLATRIAAIKSTGAPSPGDYRHWMREVARHSLFGVDKNPMAVELAKVALWIETVEPNKPLSFLDAHIRCGDSLLGVYDLAALKKGIPDEAYAPLTGDDKAAARAWRDRNRAEREARAQGQLAFFEPPRDLLEAARAIESQPEDELAAVEAKAAAHRTLMSAEGRHRLETACDLYIAAYVLPKTESPGRHVGEREGQIPTTAEVWRMAEGGQPHGLLVGRSVGAAKAARAFHWPLEFPQVFFPGAGRMPGFDLAIGNPPWERIKLQEQEFFASRAPAIASAVNKVAREQMIAALETSREGDRRLYAEFGIAKRVAEAGSVFARTTGEVGGRFPLTGAGDVNTYALFSELFATLAPRAGAIVPTGVATDATTAPFFAHLTEKQRLHTLIDFENRETLFPAVDSRMKFAILALSPNVPSARFSFFLTNTAQITDSERRFILSPVDIAAINPNTKTAPVFRSRADAELTKAIYARTAILLDEERGPSIGQAGNPWDVDVHSRFIHVTEDSGRFRNAEQLLAVGQKASDGAIIVGPSNGLAGRWLPLGEGEFGWLYDHRFATSDRGKVRETTYDEHRDIGFMPSPTSYVHEEFFEERLKRRTIRTRTHLLGFRRVSSNTNERTLVGTLLPFLPVTYGWILVLARNARESALLVSTLNSLTADYCLRNKLNQPSIPQGVLAQTAIPPPQHYSESDCAFIVPRVLELSYTSHSMRPFAMDLGFTGPPFGWDEDRRALIRAELDARIARLYGLTRDQLRYILDPEDVMGKGYPSETFRVLKQKEIAKYGDYRTARLVLAAWDRDQARE